ncbi:caspase family protein [bacterium]|nr:caspase family protein [bacterium]
MPRLSWPLQILTILILAVMIPACQRGYKETVTAPATVPPPPTTIPEVVNEPPPTPTPGIRNRFAVVIGVSRYEYSGPDGLQNLLYADDDAVAFAATLREMNWPDSRIRLLTNEEATRRNVTIALESWLTKAGPEDLIILFWSGHGFPDPEDPEKVYFACHDTDARIPATGYRMDRVRQILEERQARNVVILADTCHAGKIVTRAGSKGIAVEPYIRKIKEEQNAPRGWVFMVGAEADRQAIEHTSWKNGAFTHVLLMGLKGEADGYESLAPRDGSVTLGELRAYMESVMPDLTQKVLGTAKRPLITTSTAAPDIWTLRLDVP